MAISDRFLEELSLRTDITELIARYVALTPKGTYLFGLCPFHGEKTPSFSVTPERQMFYCYGCGVGGGSVQFLMKIENLDFREAVAVLAERAGLAMPDEGEDASRTELRRTILRVNQAAAHFFHSQLSQPHGAPALDFLRKRGLQPKTVTQFGLGFAPDAWDACLTHLVGQGFSKGDLLAAGLALTSKQGSLYDRFRNRLIFPIVDLRRQVIGFGGRVLDDTLPKYINSPETPVFSKSLNLFALNRAKNTRQGRLILAEGYMDVLSLHQAGFDCAVASLGTALTQQQALLLKRYAQEIVVAYDMDGAGQKAAQRAISMLAPLGVSVRILRMADAKDPDEYIVRFGRDAFAVLLDKAQPQMEYQLETLAARFSLDDDKGRVDFCREAVSWLCTLESAAARDVQLARVAELTRIAPEAIRLDLQKAMRRQKRKRQNADMREILRPTKTAQPAARALRYENISSAVAEEELMQMLFMDETLAAHLPPQLTPEHFASPLLAKAFTWMAHRRAQGLPVKISALDETFAPDEASHLTRILMRPFDASRAAQAVQDSAAVILSESLSRASPGDGEDPLLQKQKMYKQTRGYGGHDLENK